VERSTRAVKQPRACSSARGGKRDIAARGSILSLDGREVGSLRLRGSRRLHRAPKVRSVGLEAKRLRRPEVCQNGVTVARNRHDLSIDRLSCRPIPRCGADVLQVADLDLRGTDEVLSLLPGRRWRRRSLRFFDSAGGPRRRDGRGRRRVGVRAVGDAGERGRPPARKSDDSHVLPPAPRKAPFVPGGVMRSRMQG